MVKISADDAALFTMGTGGKSKEKIARASEADVELNHQELHLQISGSVRQRRLAKKYAELVTKQCIGVMFTPEEFDDGDITVVSVPPEVPP